MADAPLPETVDQRAASGRRPMAMHTKILLGLLVGAVLGIASHVTWSRPIVPGVTDPLDVDLNGIHDGLDWVATNVAEPLGKVFLRLMFMVVLPLVFSALVLAVVGIGDVRRLGWVGLRTLGFTMALSSIAVMLGIGMVNLIQPGHSLSKPQQELLMKRYAKGAGGKVEQAKQAKSLRDTLLDVIPENPLQEMVGAIDGSSKGNGMLAVMFFALVCGIAITTVPEECRTLVGVFEGMYAVSMQVIGFAMQLAPYGAACLVFAMTAQLGFDIMKTLFWFVLTAMSGLLLHLFVVYSIFIWLFGGMTPWQFFRQASSAMFMAFGTSSSNATLPTALKVAQDDLKLPPEISNFVLTVGATGNQNGTALYEGVVVLFLAQVFGVELTLPQQVTVAMMSILAGIGTAGVPGGSLPLIVVLLQSVGVPGAGIGIILGVDRILDMTRTVLNVMGDLTVATCVAKAEEKRTGAGSAVQTF